MAEKSNTLEPFLLLAKSARGGAFVELIKQVTEAPNVFVFGELLECPSIQDLASGPNSVALEVLKVFAYGTLRQYEKASLPELTDAQKKKLRQLTIASLASRQKSIPYDLLQSELDITNVRELEGLIIDCIYSGLVEGRLDQQYCRLEVDSVIGRDVPFSAADSIIAKLSSWCQSCEGIMDSIEAQAVRANAEKESHQIHWSAIENEISNLRKSIKSGSVESDDVPMEEIGNREMGDKTRRVPHQRKTPRRLVSREVTKD